MVPIPQDTIASPLKPRSSSVIVFFCLAVLSAIKFNNEFLLLTDEIDSVFSNWLLSAELAPTHPMHTNVPPEESFGIC